MHPDYFPETVPRWSLSHDLVVFYVFQCWFECSCLCHFPTTTEEVVSAGMEGYVPQATTSSANNGTVMSERGGEEGGRKAAAQTELPQTQACVRSQWRKQKDDGRVPRQDTDGCSGVAMKAEEGTSGTTVAIISGAGAGAESFATAGDGDSGLGHSPVQESSQDGAEEEHQKADAALPLPVDAEVPSPNIETCGYGARGGLGGTVIESFGGECGSSEDASPSSGRSDAVIPTNSPDSVVGDEHCFRCTDSCWFACPCACHASLAETSSVAMETERGNATRRRRDTANGLCRRKRQRNGREQPQIRPSNQKERRMPAVSVPDVERAFLATSEGGARPRAIHFGTAARYPHSLFGRRGCGASASGGDDDEEVAGARVSYDTRWVS